MINEQAVIGGRKINLMHIVSILRNKLLLEILIFHRLNKGSRMAKPNVLIVDDDDLLRTLTAQLVEDVGCAPLIVADANEALALLEDNSEIALMITDIQMPGPMDGLELSGVVRQRWPTVALIIVSGNVTPHQNELPDGAVFLRKPYATHRLQSNVVYAVNATD